jgi:hypothetical protein
MRLVGRNLRFCRRRGRESPCQFRPSPSPTDGETGQPSHLPRGGRPTTDPFYPRAAQKALNHAEIEGVGEPPFLGTEVRPLAFHRVGAAQDPPFG